MVWIQREIALPAFPRGFHLVTEEVLSGIPEVSTLRAGLLHVFIKHTSASITINENADPDVPRDLEMAMNKVVPESFPYVHTVEGPDDMPGHVKAAMLGSSVSIPISQGRLCLGTWQGVYLCEHRNHGGSRKLVLTLNGETA